MAHVSNSSSVISSVGGVSYIASRCLKLPARIWCRFTSGWCAEVDGPALAFDWRASRRGPAPANMIGEGLGVSGREPEVASEWLGCTKSRRAGSKSRPPTPESRLPQPSNQIGRRASTGANRCRRVDLETRIMIGI